MKNADKNKEKVRVGTIVGEYGELLGEIFEGDKIVRKEQDEYKRTHIIGFNKKEAFVKVFIHPITYLFRELSTKEYAVAMALMPFISYSDGILRYDGKIIDGKTLCELLGDNYETFKRIITSLIKKQVIGRVERPSDTYANRTRKCLVVNPYIFLRGQDIDKDIVKIFENSKWANIDSIDIPVSIDKE